MTTPTNGSGTSITTSSYGSSTSPSAPRRVMMRGARYGELVTFPPHCLHQDAEVQLTASGDRERVGRFRVFDAQRDVALELANTAGRATDGW